MAEETEHTKSEHKKIKLKLPKLNVWQTATIVLSIALILMAVGFSMNGCSITDVIKSQSKETVSQNAVDFLNSNFGTTAALKSVEVTSGVYHLTLDVDGEDVEVYSSRDGKFIFPLAINSSETKDSGAQQDTAPAQSDVVKSETPEVQLFVMSYCPYGTQMEKGMLPVVELLGDKIKFDIKFVYYAMHGETEVKEQLNQYCIETEQNSRYLDYLSCFLKDGDSETCLDETKVDVDALATCVEKADAEFSVTANLEDKASWLSGQFPLFDVHKTDNEIYNIGGSPTLVINDEQVQSGRDSASILAAVCGAFVNPPAECDETLSAASPSPGFGYEGTGSATAATCG